VAFIDLPSFEAMYQECPSSRQNVSFLPSSVATELPFSLPDAPIRSIFQSRLPPSLPHVQKELCRFKNRTVDPIRSDSIPIRSNQAEAFKG
jgi:hypothetical protein